MPLAATLLLLLGAGATRWRASWNLGGASVEHDLAALAALERGDEPRAESELRTALRYDDSNGQAWWDLGLVLERLGRHEEAAGACWRAYENMRLDREQLDYLEAVQRWALGQHYFVGEASKAFPFAKNVARLAPDDLEMWEVVRELADGLGDDEWYDRADRECARLSPRPAPEVPNQPK